MILPQHYYLPLLHRCLVLPFLRPRPRPRPRPHPWPMPAVRLLLLRLLLKILI